MKGWQITCPCGMNFSGPIRFLVLWAMKGHIARDHLANSYTRLMLNRWKKEGL